MRLWHISPPCRFVIQFLSKEPAEQILLYSALKQKSPVEKCTSVKKIVK